MKEKPLMKESPVSDMNTDLQAEQAANPYTPVPVDGFEFPVAAAFIRLSQLSMHIIPWHWHEEVEFIMIHSGITRIKLPNETLLLSPGDGMFITQNLLHSIHPYEQEDCSLFTLKFHPVFLFGYGQTSMSAKYLTPVLSSPSLQYMVLKKENPTQARMLRLVGKTIDCCIAKNFGYELETKSYLCKLWNHLLSFVPLPSDATTFPSSQSAADSVRIKEALLFIEARYMEPLTLEEIASAIHVSKSECCRCFQRSLGITPFEYLMKYRIFESTRKIMQGDAAADSIADLAASVGFNSTSYYNKVFKRYLNCTPTEYKKSMRNASAPLYFP